MTYWLCHFKVPCETANKMPDSSSLIQKTSVELNLRVWVRLTTKILRWVVFWTSYYSSCVSQNLAYSICERQLHVPFLSKFIFIFHRGSFCCWGASILLMQTIFLCSGRFESLVAKLRAVPLRAPCPYSGIHQCSNIWLSQSLCQLFFALFAIFLRLFLQSTSLLI